MIVPGMTADLAEPVAEIYTNAELRILEIIADALSKGIDAPSWELLQLARLQQVRESIVAELDEVNPRAAASIRDALRHAYGRGVTSALSDAGKSLGVLQGVTDARAAAVARLAADTAKGLTSYQPGILRRVDDVYRSIVSDVTASVLAGAEGRREATQRAIGTWLSKGITGVQTARGRIDLPNYATMAVRTATARSALAGQTDTMTELGLDLVIVHPGPRACKICDDWARMILSVNGETGTLRRTNELTGEQVEVTVPASLDDARREGWGHPNCRCGIAGYIPGVTKADTIERPPWDQEGYEAQQQQRGIERQIRGWKQAEALAITPDAKAEARAKVKAWQGAQRDHMAAHPDLKRQGKREQIGGNYSGRPPREAGAARVRPASTKQAEPESTTPKLDKLARLKMPQSYAEATKGLTVNPGYGDAAGRYGVNCTYVVSAVEMRARGLDVIARPLPAEHKSGRSLIDMMNEWRKPDGGRPTFRPVQGGKRGLEARIREEWPEGARGIVQITWKGGGGHVFNVERRDGKVIYHEGQMPDADPSSYFARRSPSKDLWVMRTDDLDMTDALDDVVYSADSSVAVALAKAKADEAAAAARTEAEKQAAHERKLAERAAFRETAEGRLEEAQNELRLTRDIVNNLLDAGMDYDSDRVQRYVKRRDEAERKFNELRRTMFL